MISWSFAVVCLLLVCGGLVSRMLTERSRAEAERAKAATEGAKAVIAAAKAQSEAEASRRSQYFTQIRQTEDELRQGAQTRAFERLEACPPDLRGWEWYRLRNLHNPTNQQATVLKPDNYENIYSVALSGDGRWIELGGHLWNLRLGKKALTIEHAGTPVMFSPDSKRIVTGNVIRDVNTGAVVMSLVGGAVRTGRLSVRTDGRSPWWPV